MQPWKQAMQELQASLEGPAFEGFNVNDFGILESGGLG
jgi:hypothetical protein